MAGNRNSGRRPKPTALKVLKGVRRDRINQNEPKAQPGEPARPEALSPGAAAVWDRLAPLCLGQGTLSLSDGDAFATLCELVATRDLASREKSAPAFQVLVGDNKPQEHPVLRLERATANALRPYFEKFGLDPQGRARLTVGPSADQGKSKWAGLIA